MPERTVGPFLQFPESVSIKWIMKQSRRPPEEQSVSELGKLAATVVGDFG